MGKRGGCKTVSPRMAGGTNVSDNTDWFAVPVTLWREYQALQAPQGRAP